jgi:hypothetical protein
LNVDRGSLYNDTRINDQLTTINDPETQRAARPSTDLAARFSIRKSQSPMRTDAFFS